MLSNQIRIQRLSVSDQIYDYMKDAIKSNLWAVNEKIPSEAELSEKFGVNRLTVRVALQKLIAIGVLEKRVGDGTYVKEFDFDTYMQNATDFYMKPELLEQVGEFRRTLELECARLAIERATEEELQTLKEISEKFKTEKIKLQGQKYRDYTDIVQVELDFHRQVCVMAHNDLFLNAFDMAKEAIKQYLQVIVYKRIELWVVEQQRDILEWKDMHEEIYQAIKAKDFEACKELFYGMIDREYVRS